jgi:CRP/FNR family cyclic AMP-dependent transcriptional regulator
MLDLFIRAAGTRSGRRGPRLVVATRFSKAVGLMAAPRDIKPAPVDRLSLLRNHPLFREFAPRILEQLASHMTRKSVPRNTIIFARGDPGSGLMGVLSGTVKISLLSTDGRELVINLIQPGEIFGEIALLDGHPRTADATTVSDCELIMIERRDFIPFVQSQPEVAIKFIEVLCARLRRTSGQLEDAVFLNLPARLAKTLLHLTGNSDKGATRKLPITQRDLSQIIGMSRESTNKQLRNWAERKWVRLERGSITILQPDALAEVAEEDVDSDSL